MKPVPAALLGAALVATLLAGCSGSAPDDAADGSGKLPGSDLLGGPQPTQQKDTFIPGPPSLVPAVLPGEPVLVIEVPSDHSRLQLAYDISGAGGAQVTMRLVESNGDTLETATTEAGKQVAFVDDASAGTARLYAESNGAWQVGAVVTVFPPNFQEGHHLQVSTPEQTEVEHKFYPDIITAAAGAPLRFTLYDYDPHAGVENLQHNLFFPGLGLKTDGKTTWGEVRVLDMPDLSPGTYEFECEFHGFTGTLTVSRN